MEWSDHLGSLRTPPPKPTAPKPLLRVSLMGAEGWPLQGISILRWGTSAGPGSVGGLVRGRVPCLSPALPAPPHAPRCCYVEQSGSARRRYAKPRRAGSPVHPLDPALGCDSYGRTVQPGGWEGAAPQARQQARGRWLQQTTAARARGCSAPLRSHHPLRAARRDSYASCASGRTRLEAGPIGPPLFL